jgi:hypothetical protein
MISHTSRRGDAEPKAVAAVESVAPGDPVAARLDTARRLLYGAGVSPGVHAALDASLEDLGRLIRAWEGSSPSPEAVRGMREMLASQEREIAALRLENERVTAYLRSVGAGP